MSKAMSFAAISEEQLDVLFKSTDLAQDITNIQRNAYLEVDCGTCAALSGNDELETLYPTEPEGALEIEPTILAFHVTSNAVREVAQQFANASAESVSEQIDEDEDMDVDEVLALISFYQSAAARNDAVVFWVLI